MRASVSIGQELSSPDITVKTFGLDSGNGTYNQFGNSLHAMRYQNTAGTGILNTLELLVDDTTPAGKVRLGVYADVNGKPGDRLLDAGEATVKNGWVSISNLNLPVEDNDYYWLAYNLQSTNGLRYQSDQTANWHYRKNNTAYGAFPSAFPSSALGNNARFVMRASVAVK
jgi:hypothetical protein